MAVLLSQDEISLRAGLLFDLVSSGLLAWLQVSTTFSLKLRNDYPQAVGSTFSLTWADKGMFRGSALDTISSGKLLQLKEPVSAVLFGFEVHFQAN